MSKIVRFFVITAFSCPSVSLAQEIPTDPTPPDPEPSHWESHHSIVVEGETVEYNALVGSIILRDDMEKATGELFYTAYFRSNGRPSTQRPIIFAYNGGPGSSSFWLHMGIMGPRRVVTPNVGQQDPPPYPLMDNAYTMLDKADIVMIDPIGTGFSRPVGDDQDFWGLDEDASSLRQFIQRFLSKHDRWNSPRYLLGESYGTTRSVVLARHLQNANIDLNGIVLVSSVLDFNTILFPEGVDLPYIVNLPSFTITSAYHGLLPGGSPNDLEAFIKEAEEWALSDYATALLMGGSLNPTRRNEVLEQMHQYTGLSRDFLDKADLKVTTPEYEKEILRDQGLSLARLDARFTGPSGDLLETTPDHDAQSSALGSAYTSLFNTYVRQELGYDGDREYVPSRGSGDWNWSRVGDNNSWILSDNVIPNVAPDLATALRRNPKLQVLLINGVYDLATPYFAASWTMDHMGLTPDLRDNIERADFAAGHMMYVEQSLLPQWRQTLEAFIERTSGVGLVP
jgi:carboxypeptidase C (cathepsin A)